MEKYLEWLHQVTIICYADDIIIPLNSEQKLKTMYQEGLSPDEAAAVFIINQS